MPLRTRLVGLVGLMLLASLACGTALVTWQAIGSVRTELRAALDVGTKTIRNGFDDLPHSNDRMADLRHLVATFDGNRHVRATLLDDRDQPVATSRLFNGTQPVPAWFRRLIADDSDSVRLPVSLVGVAGASVLLQTDPVNELGEVWGQSRDAVLVLGGFALLSALLVSVAVGRALRPLERIAGAFECIGKGDYHCGVPEHGPPEFRRLANGFNHMTQQLATAAMQNRRLNERLLTLQAEERAELARDLHDEVGPLLFAVDMTAATIERLVDSGRGPDIPVHVRSIHDSVGRMQRHVRAILERLRPLQAIELEAAIGQLVAFWRTRRPEINFRVSDSVEDDRISDDTKETIYRVIQEAVSNAIRHGAPARVAIEVTPDGADDVRVAITDDGVGMAADGMFGSGSRQFGLIGMRERVMAMAGSLSIQPGHDRNGLVIVACLPLETSLSLHRQDALE